MTALPDPLRDCLRADEEFVGLDLSGCDFDVRHVLDLAARVTREGEIRSDAELERALDLLAPASREFLPGWEEIELKATKGRGVAGSVVADVRGLVEMAHITLLDAVAVWYLARHQPHRAIAYLEDGLRQRADRRRLAVRLADAYDQAGQAELAARLRNEYGLGRAG